MADDPEVAAGVARLEAHINQLMEHFDTVQIFVTKQLDRDKDLTFNMAKGGGNFLARYGQVRYWITEREEMFRQPHRNPDV